MLAVLATLAELERVLIVQRVRALASPWRNSLGEVC